MHPLEIGWVNQFIYKELKEVHAQKEQQDMLIYAKTLILKIKNLILKIKDLKMNKDLKIKHLILDIQNLILQINSNLRHLLKKL